MALDDLTVEQFLAESHPAYRKTYEKMPEAIRKRVTECFEHGDGAEGRHIISSYYLESWKSQRGQEVSQSKRTVKAQSQSVHGEIIEVEAGAITVPELEEKLLQVAQGPDAKLTDPVPVSFSPDHLCPPSGNQQEIVAALNRLLAAYVQQLHGETLPEDQVPTLSKLKEFAFREAEPPRPGQMNYSALLFYAIHTGRIGDWDLMARMIRAWWAQPTQAKPFRPKPHGVLADLRKVSDKDRFLLGTQQPVAGSGSDRQLLFDLPELTPIGCASWLLDLYDRAGGKSMQQGRGAPWHMHLWLGAILHCAIAQRDGQWHSLTLPTREVVTWLHPDGWSQRARDWHCLPEALYRMNRELGFISVPGIGSVQIVSANIIPQTPSDPYVRFTICIPKSAAHGARVDWCKMCEYRKESAVLYRAYLSAMDFLHLSAEQGKPIEQTVKRADGQLVANPKARYVRGLTDGELTAMIGYEPGNRQLRSYARRAFERLTADGVIDTQREGRVWRIFGPPAKCQDGLA